MQVSRIIQIFLVIGMLLLVLYVVQQFNQGHPVEITLSKLKMYLSAGGQVEEVQVVESAQELRGKFVEASQAATENDNETFIAHYHDESLGDVFALMDAGAVEYKMVKPSIWENIFSPSTMLLFLLFAAPIVFLIWLMNRQMQAGGNSQAINFGKSRARLASDGKNRITFEDVAGVDEAVEELREIVDFLREPRKYEALGAEIPKGVLLIGPPGCGKTHLAKAVAGEANVPFFYISGSDFVEMFVGVGASRVRDLFDQAKRRAPCLVFVDELDAVGRHRGTGIGGTHDEREQTLNQLLVEMDGFEPNSGIIVLSATNRPDVLDPALLRPGRFDRRIVVDQPDLMGRKSILEIYVKGKPMADDVDLKEVAQRTPGFTGADLRNAVNEAALLAAREEATEVTAEHIYEAIDRVVAGPERKSRVISEHEKKIIAYHEVGHAIVSNKLNQIDPVHKISILPRGQTLGYTLQFPSEDRFLVSKQQILDRVCVALGGRAAEKLVFDDVTTGAQDDLRRSTEMVRNLITKYGMSDELGPIQYGSQYENPFLGRVLTEDRNYSDEIAYRIDLEVKNIVSKCYDRTTEVLRKMRPKMDFIVSVLLEREHLNRKEFEALMEGKELPAPAVKKAKAAPPEKDKDAAKQPEPEKEGPQPAPSPVG